MIVGARALVSRHWEWRGTVQGFVSSIQSLDQVKERIEKEKEVKY